MSKTETQYYETNEDGERVLSYETDSFVKTQNDGVHLTVNVVSSVDESSVYTYDETEGFYRLSPKDNPLLVEELDALFRVLASDFETEGLQRNPGDAYEIVVSLTAIEPDDERVVSHGRNSSHFFLSSETNFDALAVLDEVIEDLVVDE